MARRDELDAIAPLVLGEIGIERRLGGARDLDAVACPHGRDAVAQEGCNRLARRDASPLQLSRQRSGEAGELAIGERAATIENAGALAEGARRRRKFRGPRDRSCHGVLDEANSPVALNREALLTEAVEQLLSGDLETGKAVLRDYINATIGFERLARETRTPSKSLMRMLGPKGNPRASNLLAVIGKLQRVSRIHLAVAAER